MFHRLFQIFIILMVLGMSVSAQKTIALYPDSIPNSISGPDEEFSRGEDVNVLQVSRPTLSIFLPKKSAKPSPMVIICPGGGYGSLYINREGKDIAKRFAAKGIACVVLKYRLPSERTMVDRTIGPLQDVQQAVKTVRMRAREFNIDTGKVGVMGFSAGGHLAASAGVLYDKKVISNTENINLRPDYLILVYPVITMDTTLGHKGSTYNLLGFPPREEDIKAFSLDLHVNKNTPPTFLTVAADDFLLSNTMLFCAAIQKAAVSHELHVYSAGQHGYMKYPSAAEWTRPIFNWMKISGWVD